MVPIATIAVFNIAPMVFSCVLVRNRPKLGDKEMEAKIGTMYANMDVKHYWSLSYVVVFLLRRSLYVALTFLLFQVPGIQMNAFMFTSVLYLIYLGHGPVFLEKLTYIVEMANEMIFLIICYHMILFIELLEKPYLKDHIGTSLLVFMFLLLGWNTALIFTVVIKKVMRNMKLKKLKKGRDKVLTEHKEATGVVKSAKMVNRHLNQMRQSSLYWKNEQVFDQEMLYLNAKMAMDLKNLIPKKKQVKPTSLTASALPQESPDLVESKFKVDSHRLKGGLLKGFAAMSQVQSSNAKDSILLGGELIEEPVVKSSLNVEQTIRSPRDEDAFSDTFYTKADS